MPCTTRCDDNQQITVSHFCEHKRLHLESSKQNYYIISLRAIIKVIFFLAKKDVCWERTTRAAEACWSWALHKIASEEEDRVPIPWSLAQLIVVAPPQPENAVKKEKKRRHPRTRLKYEGAVAIYLARHGPKSCKTAARLAVEFCITAKAVRDAWTRKTWIDRTKCGQRTPANTMLPHHMVARW